MLCQRSAQVVVVQHEPVGALGHRRPLYHAPVAHENVGACSIARRRLQICDCQMTTFRVIDGLHEHSRNFGACPVANAALALHYITLHYITLNNITLHYITSHYCVEVTRLQSSSCSALLQNPPWFWHPSYTTHVLMVSGSMVRSQIISVSPSSHAHDLARTCLVDQRRLTSALHSKCGFTSPHPVT